MTMTPPRSDARWHRTALYGIGAWTMLGGVSALLDPAAHAAMFFAASPVHAAMAGAELLVFRIAYAQLIAWGLGYMVAARCAGHRTPILVAGGVGKLAYAFLTVHAYVVGSGTAALLMTGVGDLIVATFFAYLVAGTRTGARSDALVALAETSP